MAVPPGSPQVPTDLRASRKRKLPYWIVVVALLAFLGVTSWWSQRPLARIPLPEGGELLLVEAHYGPTLHYREALGFWKRLQRFLSDDPRPPFSQFNGTTLGKADDPPRLWLTFEGRDAGTGRRNLPHIFSVDALESGQVVGSAGISWSLDRPSHVVGLTSYPRRARQLQLRIHTDKQVANATIPNPFPMADVPLWTPKPVPQSRKIGERAIVLERWERTSTRLADGAISFHIETMIEVRESGVSPYAFDIAHNFSDATGNVSRSVLPSSEPAWKIHTTVRPNEWYPFPASEIGFRARTTMPDPDGIRIFELPATAAMFSASHAVLTGPGKYRVRFGKELRVEPASDDGAALSTPGETWTFSCTRPELRVFGPRDFGSYHTGAQYPRPLVRAVVGDRMIRCESTEYSPNSSPSSPWMVAFRIGNQNEEPLAGDPFEIQFIPVREESVDFFVRPP